MNGVETPHSRISLYNLNLTIVNPDTINLCRYSQTIPRPCSSVNMDVILSNLEFSPKWEQFVHLPDLFFY